MRLLTGAISAMAACWLPFAAAEGQEIVRFAASQPGEARAVSLRGELYRPDGTGRAPAVVLMHGCGGWQPAVQFTLRGYAETLRQRGYVVLNLDSFGPRYRSGAEMCASNALLQQALSYRTADAYDAAAYLRRLPDVDGDNIFLLGQSNGGSATIRAALQGTYETHRKAPDDPPFRGAVALYPWCGHVAAGADFATPVHVFSGARDDWVSAGECAGVRATGAGFQVTVYPRAAHSFDLEITTQRYAGFMVGRDPQAAEDSLKRIVAFLEDRVSRREQAAAR